MKPAMTREEWDRALCHSCQENALASTVGMREDLAAPGTPDCVAAYNHATAALCLHNQPFGFHREDVANIRDALIFKYREPDDERNEQLESLADRIEALLPPKIDV